MLVSTRYFRRGVHRIRDLCVEVTCRGLSCYFVDIKFACLNTTKGIPCSKRTARSARHTTNPADKTQVSLIRFTDGQHDPRIHQTIRTGHTIREYITRSLRIVRNDKIHHGLKDSQVEKKVHSWIDTTTLRLVNTTEDSRVRSVRLVKIL